MLRSAMLLGALATGLVLLCGAARAGDEVPMPPASEGTFSPGGAFLLRVLAAPDWQRDRPALELVDLRGGGRELLWRRELPHELRPRFALVSDRARVLLLDEWWNTQSGRAVMLLDSHGKTVATHSFEAVRAALDASDAALMEGARFGPWIGGPPDLASDGRTVLVPAAGGALAVDLETGRLSFAR